MPSRNSSWGSGDNNQRIIPSRNSSWGSYDTKANQLSLFNDDPVNISSSGIFAYEKDEIPWHPGTVKRTKQKIEEKHVPPASNTTLLRSSSANDANKKTKSCDIKKHGSKTSTSSTCSIKQPQRKCVKLASNDMPLSNEQVRSKSEEYLIENDSGHVQLSASAPETSSMMNKLQERRQKSCDSAQTVGSKVKNLKMNFEAKANQSQKKSSTSSLPSSPIAIHIDVPQVDIFPNEIKALIHRYEPPISPNGRPRPKSMHEPKLSSKTSSSAPFQPNKFITHQTKLPKTDGGEFKRPPIPAQQPIVKNALMSVNTNQQNVKPTLGKCRNIQQHGKTHPLAKLGINKPRINASPATAYNTM